MIRIAAIGNSHLGAIAQGWPLVPELHDDLELTFFGAPGEQLRNLAVVEGKLEPTTLRTERCLVRSSQGRSTIDGDAYDAVIIVGGLGFAWITNIYMTHRPVAHAGDRHDLISGAALDATIDSVLMATIAPPLVRMLHQITDAPVTVVTDPYPNSRIVDFSRFARRWTGDHLDDLRRRYESSLARVSDELSVPIYTQPAATFEPPCFTSPRFAMDDPKSGITHTGPEFGAEVLRELAPRLRESVELTAGSR